MNDCKRLGLEARDHGQQPKSVEAGITPRKENKMLIFRIQNHVDFGCDLDEVSIYRDESEAYEMFKRSCEAMADEYDVDLDENPIPQNPWDDDERESDDVFLEWRCEDSKDVEHAIIFSSYFLED